MAENEVIGEALSGLGIQKGMLTGAGQTVGWIALATLGAIIIGLLIFVIIELSKYKHKIVLRNKTSGVPVVIEDKARIFYTKSGLESYWKLLKTKSKIPIPPDEAREQTDKGSFYVRANIEAEKGILFFMNYYKKKRSVADPSRFEWIKADDESVQKAEEKLTTNTTIFHTNQIEKAHMEKSGKSIFDVISQAIMPVFFILVLLLLLIFIPGGFESWNKNIIEPIGEILDDVSDLFEKVEASRDCRATTTIQPETVRPD